MHCHAFCNPFHKGNQAKAGTTASLLPLPWAFRSLYLWGRIDSRVPSCPSLRVKLSASKSDCWMVLPELASIQPPWGTLLKGALKPAETNAVLKTITGNTTLTSDPAIPPLQLFHIHQGLGEWQSQHFLFCKLQQKQVNITYMSYQGYFEEQGEKKRWWQGWTRLDRKETERERKRIAGRRKQELCHS